VSHHFEHEKIDVARKAMREVGMKADEACRYGYYLWEVNMKTLDECIASLQHIKEMAEAAKATKRQEMQTLEIHVIRAFKATGGKVYRSVFNGVVHLFLESQKNDNVSISAELMWSPHFGQERFRTQGNDMGNGYFGGSYEAAIQNYLRQEALPHNDRLTHGYWAPRAQAEEI
jgi:hypothetical protein